MRERFHAFMLPMYTTSLYEGVWVWEYVCVSVWVCVCMCEWVSLCVGMFRWVSVCRYVCVWLFVSRSFSVCVSLCYCLVCVYVCVYVFYWFVWVCTPSWGCACVFLYPLCEIQRGTQRMADQWLIHERKKSRKVPHFHFFNKNIEVLFLFYKKNVVKKNRWIEMNS